MGQFNTSDNEFFISGSKVHIEANRLFINGESYAYQSEAAGGGLPEASGILLWNRDDSLSGSLVGLSDEVALVSGLVGGGGVTQAVVDSLSGNLVASGATFNQTGLGLWNRDLVLSDNLSLLSGLVFPDLGTLPTINNRITSLTGSLNETGLNLWNRDVGLSTNLVALSGTVGTNSTSITLQTNRTTSLTGSMNTTGLNLFNRDLQLSNNVATLSGTVATQGTNLTLQTNRITSLTGSMNTTGLNLFNRDLQLSNNVATISGTAGTNSSSITALQDVSGAAQKALFVDYVTNNERFPFFFTDRPITCLAVHSVAKGESATASISWGLYYGTDATAAGTTIITDTTTSITTVDTNTTFTNSSVPANNFVIFRTTATGASTTGISVTLIHK